MATQWVEGRTSRTREKGLSLRCRANDSPPQGDRRTMRDDPVNKEEDDDPSSSQSFGVRDSSRVARRRARCAQDHMTEDRTNQPCRELAGTRVMVTGATSGLGAAMASALASAGARVVVTSRQLARAQAAAQTFGDDAWGVALDVRDESAVGDVVAEVWERCGGLDMLVNNAGIGMRTVNPRFLTDAQPFWEVDPDGFHDVIDTKVTGSFLVARAVAPLMVAAGAGRIVTISMSEQTMTRQRVRALRPGRRCGRGAVPDHGGRSGRHAGDRQPPASGGCHCDRHGSRRHASGSPRTTPRSRGHGTTDRLVGVCGCRWRS